MSSDMHQKVGNHRKSQVECVLGLQILRFRSLAQGHLAENSARLLLCVDSSRTESQEAFGKSSCEGESNPQGI